ncbi:MAG: serine hydrolase [Bacteroidota bacterium]
MKRFFRGVGKFILGFLALIILFIPIYVYFNRGVITGYAAKKMCTCVFMADRVPQTVTDQDFNIFPNSLTIKNAETIIDSSSRVVTASFWGKEQQAVFREGLGCALVHEGKRPDRGFSPSYFQSALDSDTLLWPKGNLIQDTTFIEIEWDSLDRAVAAGFDPPGAEPDLMTRAVVVVYKDFIVAEKYAEGFDASMPQHGWSMGKSIANALIGILVRDSLVDIYEPIGIDSWQNDGRNMITWDHLLRMSSGLEWNEGYFGSSDVTSMLFEHSNMGAYAASLPLDTPPDSSWNYSSGTTNILSLLMQEKFPSQEAYWHFPYDSLFAQIGMKESFLEADASGHYVLSSFAWATPRDWARFGMLFLHDGVWQGKRILPEGWVDYTISPTPTTSGFYGAQFWLNKGERKMAPDLPDDAYCARGHDGQRVYIIPSYDLVVVRLGLKNMDDNEFIKGILGAIQQ